MPVRIVFRGLLLFHKMDDHMEIGVLNGLAHGTHGHPHPHPPGPAHIPRIIKTKNGVISRIFDLRNQPELGNIREWDIVVSHPLQDTATTFQHGEEFHRLTHASTRDFRWITDLESAEFHNQDLTSQMDTEKLLMVLKVRNGEFYTGQLSRPLRRRTMPSGEEVDFGRAAEVIACDIPIDQGDVQLVVDENVAFRFNETTEDNVVYEFSNAPPDVLPDRPYLPTDPGHFGMYYGLFREPGPPVKFNLFPKDDPEPAPDPAVCGATSVGDRDGGL